MTTLTLGIVKPICHVNFYPDYALTHPKCRLGLIDVSCNHDAGIYFYASSLQASYGCSFEALKCVSDNGINK
jgi:hypothetical protein